MSDIEKKVEEPVSAFPETTPAIAEPTMVDTTPAATESSATETPAPATEDPITETDATPAAVTESEEVKEIAPISEGTLGYKAPGLLKSLRFSKKFFWFGDEAVEPKHLANYLRGEKPEVGNKNGAWAAHTGKGLLFFSKTAGEKATPGGIINLAEISDVSKDGAVEFFFSYQSHKHAFQAATAAERDSWVAELSSAATEAKANAEGVISSEAYKEHLAALSKPSIPAVAKKEEKAEEKAEKKEDKKEEKAAEAAEKKEVKEEKKEEKVDRKSRSQSRKRTSIFGGFNKKKEESKIAEPETVAAPAEAPATTDAAEDAPVEAAAPAEAAPVETVEAIETTAETARPAATKRSSIFGQLQSRFSIKKEETAAPAVPAKDDAVPETSDVAPVIPAVETETPLSADINSPVTVPTETIAPEVTEAAPAETTPKAEKRKSSLPFGLGGKNSPSILSRFGTKKNKKAATEETAAPVTSEKVPEASTEAPVSEIPVTNGEAPAESTPVVSATA